MTRDSICEAYEQYPKIQTSVAHPCHIYCDGPLVCLPQMIGSAAAYNDVSARLLLHVGHVSKDLDVLRLNKHIVPDHTWLGCSLVDVQGGLRAGRGP
jgi:hypothetical protein